jgi:hypothetical protein
MAVHQTIVTSRRRPYVADTFGMSWEKNKYRQTGPFIARMATLKVSQDTATGISNF